MVKYGCVCFNSHLAAMLGNLKAIGVVTYTVGERQKKVDVGQRYCTVGAGNYSSCKAILL